MAPAAVDSYHHDPVAIQQKLAAIQLNTVEPKFEGNLARSPLKLAGAIEAWKNFDVTPVLGREFENIDLASILRADNSDELIRDLAITISARGVVFFRKQDDLDNELQKELVQRLGQLSGKPSASGLHIHPFSNASKDNKISVLSSEMNKQLFTKRDVNPYFDAEAKRQNGAQLWHSDITFEQCPSDYAVLRMTRLPKTGGDTLFASGYELFDRLSAPYQMFLEHLTATYAQTAAAKGSFEIYSGERGSPENVGDELSAIHPVVRTNPVTGWKSIMAIGSHVRKINGLTAMESQQVQGYLTKLLVENHDMQLRFRWANVNDVAIWDNRCVFHAATPDIYEAGLGERTAQRAVSVGEKPYLDQASSSRREALAEMTQGAVTSALF